MNNEQRNMLRALQALGLALIDTALFLDTHPNNQRALEFYRRTGDAYRVLKEQYTTKYGTFLMADAAGESWEWINEPWPWQNKEV